jgi:hypothetical protein
VRLGRRFGWAVSATYPFATLHVDHDAITLRLFGTPYRIARSQVRHVRLIGPDWLPPGFHGIVISHDAPNVPHYFLFWSFNRKALLGALRAEGYNVSHGGRR